MKKTKKEKFVENKQKNKPYNEDPATEMSENEDPATEMSEEDWQDLLIDVEVVTQLEKFLKE